MKHNENSEKNIFIMKNTLHAMYLKIDTASKSLAKNALSQLILKILFHYDKELSRDEIKNEVNSILNANLKRDRIDDALILLVEEDKVKFENERYYLTTTRKGKIDVAYKEYNNRIMRIIEKFFTPVKSEKTAVRNWFETVTIQFFTEYKSEWIAEKAYKTKKENSYEGLSRIIDTVTRKDRNIKDEDKDWLRKRYFKFFESSDDDVVSIFWDFGTCAFSSTLITANTSADKLSLDSFKNSVFILDTNILMYLHLEEGLFYKSYESLEKIFTFLNITPAVFKITRDEYVRTIGNKRDDILRIIQKYDEEVIDKLEDAFVKTARARQCVNPEDYEVFFDDLMDVPSVFVNSVQIKMIDDIELDSVIENGQEDEVLIQKLNEIFKNRYKIKKNGSNGNTQATIIKDKRKRPLMHDAGLIAGAEYLREIQNCYILSRDITVKQYGIENVLRDEPAISIGLDSLISMLALDNGGIDIDPTNFKPLFANIIKLALIPERETFQLGDLARMLDVEEQISQLPSEEIIEIAKGVNRSKFLGVDDEKITLELTRSFQNHKLKLKNDLDVSKKETLIEREEKNRIMVQSLKNEEALRKTFREQLMKSYKNRLLKNRILFFLIYPLLSTFVTLLIIYIPDAKINGKLVPIILGVLGNILAWALGNFFYVMPKVIKTYESSVLQIEKEVDKKMNEI